MTKEEKLKKIIKNNRQAIIHDGKRCFIDRNTMPVKTAGEGFKGNVQNWLKYHGKLYAILRLILKPGLANPRCSQYCRHLLGQFDKNSIILNIGSGPDVYMGRPDIINIDIFGFDEVDLIADAADLPLNSDSADLIINRAMLEHVARPKMIVNEMHRLLKTGGRIICYLPFMVPFHAAPGDYHRWTISGVRALFKDFDELEILIGNGPTSAFLWIFQEWLSILFSFGSKTLHDVILLSLMAVTFPLKLLDLFMVHLPYAENISSIFCVMGKKQPENRNIMKIKG
jgi:SAM-dependent methyltransferase